MSNPTVRQIYHVSRCGSTLLAAMMSSMAPVYCEPRWGLAGVLGGDPSGEAPRFDGCVVKFQSLASWLGSKPAGPKVFLYRPLAQHLCKMRSCEPEWLQSRFKMIKPRLRLGRPTALAEVRPSNDLEVLAYFWAACVIEMQEQPDVLWVQANDFFLDKATIADRVASHLGLTGKPEYRYGQVNVKALKINSSDEVVPPFDAHNLDASSYTYHSHGVIGSDLALADPAITKTVEWATECLPINQSLMW